MLSAVSYLTHSTDSTAAFVSQLEGVDEEHGTAVTLT